MKVAPAHRSPYRCPSCMRRLTLAQERIVVANGDLGRYTCSCGKIIKDCGEPITEIRATSAHLLNAEEVLSASWFHTSKRGDWAAQIQEYRQEEEAELMVHLGTEASARHRANDLEGNPYTVQDNGNDWILYEVKLLAGTAVPAGIGLEDTWPEDTGSLERSKYYRDNYIDGANRYLNAWEDPGSISLLIPANRFQIVSRQVFDPLATKTGRTLVAA